MFKRRIPRKTTENLREAFWPRMGWLRVFHYYRHRIFRGGDSTYRITAGLASGVAVSCSPFLGTHILQSVLLARVLKANWIAALAGTLWGNPWTFPFLFSASYLSGAWLLGVAGFEGGYVLPDYINMDFLISSPWDFLRYLSGHPFEILLPMTIGSLITGAAFWFFAYGVLYYPVRMARRSYKKQRLALRRKLDALRQRKSN